VSDTDQELDHAAALYEQNRLLGELIREGDLAAPVPTCPGWTVRQLFRHVGRGDRWAAQIVTDRMDGPLDPRQVREGKPPEDTEGALHWLSGSAAAVVEAAAEAGVGTSVWTFLGPRPAPWWVRRRLHEATVHRADAALALGQDYTLEPALAADGIDEWLELLAARPGDGPLADGVVLHLHATDPGLGERGEWTIDGTDGPVRWSHGHAKGAVALRGPATELFLAIMRRRAVDESDVELHGDAPVWTSWLERTGF
jgi:uncharacterized protein (TIGR03083 family)